MQLLNINLPFSENQLCTEYYVAVVVVFFVSLFFVVVAVVVFSVYFTTYFVSQSDDSHVNIIVVTNVYRELGNKKVD